jgi:transcriptional regulator with XRE-family HTH domain
MQSWCVHKTAAHTGKFDFFAFRWCKGGLPKPKNNKKLENKMAFLTNIITETPDMDTMGGRLSRAREAKSMSVSQVAGRIGVQPQTITAWESDRSEPRANRLVMLAGFLGVSPTWLIHGVGQSPREDETGQNTSVLTTEIDMLKVHHEQLGDRIEQLENVIARLKAA